MLLKILCQNWNCSASAHHPGLTYEKRAYPCYIILAYSVPDLLVVGSAYTILYYPFFVYLEEMFCRMFPDRDR